MGDRTALIPGTSSHVRSADLSDVDVSSGLADCRSQGQFAGAPISETLSWKRLLVFMGPGFLVSTSFLDPGNFDTDIQAGARFEYGLVWVLIAATMLGLMQQNLTARLGVVTGPFGML